MYIYKVIIIVIMNYEYTDIFLFFYCENNDGDGFISILSLR